MSDNIFKIDITQRTAKGKSVPILERLIKVDSSVSLPDVNKHFKERYNGLTVLVSEVIAEKINIQSEVPADKINIQDEKEDGDTTTLRNIVLSGYLLTDEEKEENKIILDEKGRTMSKIKELENKINRRLNSEKVIDIKRDGKITLLVQPEALLGETKLKDVRIEKIRERYY